MNRQDDFVVDRRTTLRWFVASVAASTMQLGYGGSEAAAAEQALVELGIAAIPDGKTYGTDPDVVNPVVPWARTMTKEQLRLAAALSDAILPATGTSPAPSALGVQDFIDEWVSAPYSEQQADRDVILDGLQWLQQEAFDRFSTSFADMGEPEQRAILDDIAFRDSVKPGLETAAHFFAKFRHLAMSAYYSTEPGMAEIGYLGNTPIAGDYPGPTPEAMAHLGEALKRLGLG